LGAGVLRGSERSAGGERQFVFQAGVQMKVHELVARFARAAEGADPMASTREVIDELHVDIAEIGHALQFISGAGDNAHQVFYRLPDLTVLKVRLPAGRRTPPDHGSWAKSRRSGCMSVAETFLSCRAGCGNRRPSKHIRWIWRCTKTLPAWHQWRPVRRQSE